MLLHSFFYCFLVGVLSFQAQNRRFFGGDDDDGGGGGNFPLGTFFLVCVYFPSLIAKV